MPSKKYQSSIESNNAFMVKMEELVKEIVIQNNVPYYRIESRMEHQLSESGENVYVPVVRVITYFEDSVSHISEIICAEFDVVNERSKDKKRVRLDSFSYKHVQLTATLKPARQELIEYRRSGSKSFEVHVCSMLQDAWAGIEKELGYDSATFPEEMKRDFYRVGALLEMADLEFLKIRSVLNSKYGWVEGASGSQAEMAEPMAAPVARQQPAPAPKPVEAYVPQPVPQPVAPQPAPQQVPAPAPQPVMQQPEPTPVVVPQPVMQQPEPVAVPAPQPAPQPVYEPAPQPVMQQPQPVAEEFIPQQPVAHNGMQSPAELTIPAPQPEPVAAAPEQVIEATPAVAETPEVDLTALEEVPQIAAQTVNVAASTVNVASHNTYIQNVEAVREQEVKANTPAASGEEVPFYERVEEPVKPAGLDENAQMTDATLKNYVMGSKVIKEIDSEIARRAGATLNTDVDIEGDVERLKYLKVYSLKQLHERVMDNKNDLIAFAEKWIGKDNGGSFDSGICLFYLEYLLVGKKNDPAFAVEYVLKFISDNDYSARFIIPTYNSISKSDKPIASHLTLK